MVDYLPKKLLKKRSIDVYNDEHLTFLIHLFVREIRGRNWAFQPMFSELGQLYLTKSKIMS